MVKLSRIEIDNRIKEMDANNSIEGIFVNEEYRKFTNNLRDEGYTEEEILIKFINKVKK